MDNYRYNMKNAYVAMAFSIAKESPCQNQVGAVILDSMGNLLSSGYSTNKKTHTTQAHFAKKTGQPYKIYLHAEISALVKTKRRQAHTLIVIRTSSTGNTQDSKPCPICTLAIKESGLKFVVYCKDGKMRTVNVSSL